MSFIEVEKFDNAVREFFSVSQDDYLKKEAQLKRQRAKKSDRLTR